jgi:hypothetical protein
MSVTVSGRGIGCCTEFIAPDGAGVGEEDRRTLAGIALLDLSRNHITSFLRPLCAVTSSTSPSRVLSSTSSLSLLTGLRCLIADRNALCPNLLGLSAVSSTLVELHVSNNQLESLEGLEKCACLRILDVSRNNLKSLKGLPHLAAWKDDDVEQNRLGKQTNRSEQSDGGGGFRLTADYNHLPSKVLSELQASVGPALAFLSLAHNKLEDAAAVVGSLISVDSPSGRCLAGDRRVRFPRLSELDLSWNPLLVNGSINRWCHQLSAAEVHDDDDDDHAEVSSYSTDPEDSCTVKNAGDHVAAEDVDDDDYKQFRGFLSRRLEKSVGGKKTVKIVLRGYRHYSSGPDAATAASFNRNRVKEPDESSNHRPGEAGQLPGQGHAKPLPPVERKKPSASSLSSHNNLAERESLQRSASISSLSSFASAPAAHSALAASSERGAKDEGQRNERKKGELRRDVGHSCDDDRFVETRLLQETESLRSERVALRQENKALQRSLAASQALASAQLETIHSLKAELERTMEDLDALHQRYRQKAKENDCLAHKCRELEKLLHQREVHDCANSTTTGASLSLSEKENEGSPATAGRQRLHVTTGGSVLFTHSDLLQMLSVPAGHSGNGAGSRSKIREEHYATKDQEHSRSFARTVANTTLSRSREATNKAFGILSSTPAAEDAPLSERPPKKRYVHQHRSYHAADLEPERVEEGLRRRAIAVKHGIEHELFTEQHQNRSDAAGRSRNPRQGKNVHSTSPAQKLAGGPPGHIDCTADSSQWRVRWATDIQSSSASLTAPETRSFSSNSEGPISRTGQSRNSCPRNEEEAEKEEEAGLVRRLVAQLAELEATCAEQSRFIDDLSEENDNVVRKYELAVSQFALKPQGSVYKEKAYPNESEGEA